MFQQRLKLELAFLIWPWKWGLNRDWPPEGGCFKGHFYKDDTKLPDIENKTDTILSHVDITQESMFKKLNCLNISRSCGPDGLHPKVLK